MFDAIDSLARYERKLDREFANREAGSMTSREWVSHNLGSAAPKATSIEAIFAAYNDYRISQQWE